MPLGKDDRGLGIPGPAAQNFERIRHAGEFSRTRAGALLPREIADEMRGSRGNAERRCDKATEDRDNTPIFRDDSSRERDEVKKRSDDLSEYRDEIEAGHYHTRRHSDEVAVFSSKAGRDCHKEG
jgi:hypothetical protein